MPDVTRYIQRISWLLRQGEPANQVAVLLPTDDAWASFTPAHVTVTGAMQKLVTAALMSAILSAGYNVDYIDADAINSVGLGNHQILVLPPTDRIPLETLKKIDDYALHGGKIIAIGKLPSVDPEGKPLPASQLAPIALIQSTDQLPQALHDAARPDLAFYPSAAIGPDPLQCIGFIRRKLPDADIYFVTNTSNHPIKVGFRFATSFQNGVQINPDSGSESYALSESADFLAAPYESRVYIFAKDAPSGRRTTLGEQQQLADLSTDWTVTFTSANATETQPTLTDWTASADTLQYSGEAVYARDFTLTTTPKTPTFLQVEGGKPLPGAPNSPPEHPTLGSNGLPDPHITRPGPGMHAYYDPPIHEAAIVFLNGQRAGSLWHPPYRLDLSKLLKPGQNHIEIHVYNTALNAWSALPPHDYKPLIEKYGDRFQMQDLDKVRPIPSGILGTIHLVATNIP
jgi:hypothetical protein